jgi:hypothetical protein
MKTDNELIAEFMGKPDHIMSELLKYHTSWDWLMPVIHKIFTVPFDSVDGLREFTDKPNTIFDALSFGLHSEIEEVHKAVVEFIKWYNSNEGN